MAEVTDAVLKTYLENGDVPIQSEYENFVDSKVNVNAGMRVYNARFYGAVGDGATSDNVALDAAVTACPVGNTVYVPASTNGYVLASTLTIAKNINFIMERGAYFIFTGTGVAVDFTSSLQRVKIDIAIDADAIDWTAGQIGVRFTDVISSEIHLSRVYGFEYGADFYNALAGGTIFNNAIYVGQIYSNRYGIRLKKDGGNGINGNKFFAGNWSVAAAVQPSTTRFAVWIEDAGTNVFFGPTWEVIDGSSGGTATGMYCKGISRWNKVIDGYAESATYIIGAEGAAKYNKFTGHVSTLTGTIADNTVNEVAGLLYPGTNVVENTDQDNVDRSVGGVREVWPVTDVFSRTVGFSGAGATTELFVPGFVWSKSSDGSYVRSWVEDGNMFLSDSYLALPATAALGRKVDTSIVKSFWLDIERATAGAYTAVVVAYDASGARLTSGTHVQGTSVDTSSATDFAYSATFGGSYQRVLRSVTRRVFFHVESTVKSIFVGVQGTTSPASLGVQGISLKCGADRAPPSWAGYDLVSNGIYADPGAEWGVFTAPTGGVLNQGQFLRSLVATSAATPGWIIDARVSTLANGGEPAAEATVVVDDSTGMTAADVLGVVITRTSDSVLRWWWTTVSSVPGGGVSVIMAAAVPTGYTIADNAKLITYRPLALAVLP